MKAILVRIGVDHSYGEWNAPADPESGRFVYVPIPEGPGTRFHAGCRRDYDEILPPLRAMAEQQGLDLVEDFGWPEALSGRAMHLDPDFEHLTYGDVGDARGAKMRHLKAGDLLVFYAGLRPTRPCDQKLIYAIVGLFVVKEVVEATKVTASRYHENAHTRKRKRGSNDIIVRAEPGCSGRLARYLSIGEYRAGAYRVRRDLLETWGGLSVKDGYIQRSARPPHFLAPERFYRWFQKQQISLLQANNPATGDEPVVLVHLRQPRRSDPNEMRSDPFWEFGSFGCTGCHESNLMHPDKVDDLEGARLGFVQGGPARMKLVLLTPPVEVVRHPLGSEVRWQPAEMPFRYDAAPLLVDDRGRSDFPELRKQLRGVNRETWCGAFSSRFRSRTKPLPHAVAQQIREIHDQMRRSVNGETLAADYIDALPYPPNRVDQSRKRTLNRLRTRAQGGDNARSTCRSRSTARRRC